MFQAQANLLDDAHKYAPEGKLIHLYARLSNNHVELAAIDHGHGIPRELHSVALQLSRCLDKGRELPGDGLGLPLVKAIAELYRGELLLEDTGQPGRLAMGLGSVLPIQPPLGEYRYSRLQETRLAPVHARNGFWLGHEHGDGACRMHDHLAADLPRNTAAL